MVPPLGNSYGGFPCCCTQAASTNAVAHIAVGTRSSRAQSREDCLLPAAALALIPASQMTNDVKPETIRSRRRSEAGNDPKPHRYCQKCELTRLPMRGSLSRSRIPSGESKRRGVTEKALFHARAPRAPPHQWLCPQRGNHSADDHCCCPAAAAAATAPVDEAQEEQ